MPESITNSPVSPKQNIRRRWLTWVIVVLVCMIISFYLDRSILALVARANIDGFPGDPGQRRFVLHHRKTYLETFQIKGKALSVGASVEPFGQIGPGRCGQVHLLLFGQLDDGVRPDTAVEMIVKLHLRELSYHFPCYHVGSVHGRTGLDK